MDEVLRDHPDIAMAIHLGDYVRDAEAIAAYFPSLDLRYVRGNCDAYSRSDAEENLLFNADGVRIFMTHGHRYGVKSGYLRAIYAAREQEADLLLFGHTHYADCFQEGPLWVLNPGAARNGSYGIITLSQDGMECCLGRQDGKEHYDAANH